MQREAKMERQITRRYAFAKKDLKEMILEWLRDKDLPVPANVDDATWDMDGETIALEWTAPS
ncbi:hypothetical protein CCR97_08000 [Rhodoplanes elegans]|uniref:Uncharacterized protein n=2 Tax=Rhodoplanes elegans TaxID=29408 RepID=A0A327KNH1_9BRAD|nr:hypothetical protein [Rhodoplanes elegans]MBK5958153.1 hypothetical protein [Rhodoplanes elegans]RAI40440.1 hypothetical protein CH338_06250 [Rhodoplanes elegans]